MDSLLRVRRAEGWYSFRAILEIDGLRAVITVHDLGPSTLPELFADMAREWQGWTGEKHWASLEDDLSLTCRSDRTGHAYVEVMMKSGVGGPDEWVVQATLRIDVGHYEIIAKQLARRVEQGAA